MNFHVNVGSIVNRVVGEVKGAINEHSHDHKKEEPKHEDHKKDSQHKDSHDKPNWFQRQVHNVKEKVEHTGDELKHKAEDVKHKVEHTQHEVHEKVEHTKSEAKGFFGKIFHKDNHEQHDHKKEEPKHENHKNNSQHKDSHDKPNWLQRTFHKAEQGVEHAAENVKHKAEDVAHKAKHEVDKHTEQGKSFGERIKGIFHHDDHQTHKPVRHPEARDLNEDGKVSRDEANAYKSVEDLKKSGKLDEKGFKNAIDNLHDKCRGHDSSVAAHQVSSSQGHGQGQHR